MREQLEDSELLTQDFLNKIKLLHILSKKAAVNSGPSQSGEHISQKKGRSLEFNDFRNYVHGDDIRYIDWNIYGRLEKLFLKLFIEEVDLNVYAILDCSKSMELGNPQKLLYSKKIAACMCYIALSNYDRAGIVSVDARIKNYLPPVRGRNQIFECFRFLDNEKPGGKTNLGKALIEFGKRKLRPGLVIIISDFFSESDFFNGINLLLHKKNSVFLIQVMDEYEKKPDFKGDIKLVDIETEDIKEVSMTDSLIKTYIANLNSYCNNIENFCRKRGIGYLQTVTTIPFEEIILKYLRIGRLLV